MLSINALPFLLPLRPLPRFAQEDPVNFRNAFLNVDVILSATFRFPDTVPAFDQATCLSEMASRSVQQFPGTLFCPAGSLSKAVTSLSSNCGKPIAYRLPTLLKHISFL